MNTQPLTTEEITAKLELYEREEAAYQAWMTARPSDKDKRWQELNAIQAKMGGRK